jgi:hypothetical protein
MFTAAFAVRPTAHPYSSVAKNDESPDEPRLLYNDAGDGIEPKLSARLGNYGAV